MTDTANTLNRTDSLMDRRRFMQRCGVGLGLVGFGAMVANAAEQPQRPNILWITCEDISPYLGVYGCPEAKTPNLDRLAAEGIRYTRAYANSPVCAVARSALLTGMHSPAIGTQGMRSRVQLPESVPAYPKLLRKAGYYCTNNSKKDYNSNYLDDPSLWDESSGKAHWKNRRPGQPFMAVFNIHVTHESQLAPERIQQYVRENSIPKSPRISPDEIRLPPYHPDLPEIRQDWARLHDLITLMDALAGQRLDELAAAGLAEDTIVFFYSDHGGQLARSKRFIYNVGTQVPLIVRIPQKWKHLATAAPGGRTDRLVSFVDIPKTTLSLAQVPVPKQMQGHIFLGPDTETEPSNVYLYRDRQTERFDFSRATTDGRWYYIRHFMPHRPEGRDTRYGNQVQANWRAWEAHYDAGKCPPVQSRFYQPKPPVQLFDTQSDPWHVTNLADRPEHNERVRQMSRQMDDWMIGVRDTGLIPESMFYDLVGPQKEFKTVYEYAQSSRYPVQELLEAAKAASLGDPGKQDRCLNGMRNANPIARYWGAYGIFLIRPKDQPVQNALRDMISQDPLAANRLMAAQALGLCGEPLAAFQAIFKEAVDTEHGYVFLQAINAFQYSHTDDRLTKEHWEMFQKKPVPKTGTDQSGFEYARRIIDDALALWPNRRIVD